MSKLGAAPESLRRLATTFERAGDGLEDDARPVGRKIRATEWDGADAQRLAAVSGATLDRIVEDVLSGEAAA